MKRLDDILNYNLKIYQDSDFFSFSLDSIVLANYSKINKNDTKIIDLCTGNGVVPIILNKRFNKKIDCIEIQEKLVELAKDSIKENDMDNSINVICGDINNYFDSKFNNYYDVVLCNPPYFNSCDIKNVQNLSYEKKVARHEVLLNLNGLLSCVKKILRNDGVFFLVHRSDRLEEILFTLKKNNLIPKRLFFVHESIEKQAILVFIESRLNGRDGMVVDKPLILYDLNGNMTEDYKRLNEEVL